MFQLDRLSNEQIIPILLALDPESLLNCGRASPRLYRLVCDREVWKHLLKGIDFTEEQLEELTVFGLGLFEIDGRPEMMPEVVKEAARRFALDLNPGVGMRRVQKVTIAVQGTADTWEVDAGRHFKDLTRVGVGDISMKNYRKPINRYF